MLTDDFLRKDIENRKYVNEFCEKYSVVLLRVGVTEENGKPEHAYTFSDDFGYYTIKGIRKSLRARR